MFFLISVRRKKKAEKKAQREQKRTERRRKKEEKGTEGADTSADEPSLFEKKVNPQTDVSMDELNCILDGVDYTEHIKKVRKRDSEAYKFLKKPKKTEE